MREMAAVAAERREGSLGRGRFLGMERERDLGWGRRALGVEGGGKEEVMKALEVEEAMIMLAMASCRVQQR